MSGLSEYEKKRLANIKENNEILRGLGLLSTAQRTERKRPNKRRKRQDDSDSEDEWLPGLSDEPKPFSRQKVTVLKPEERKPLARIVLQADEKVTTALINRKSVLPGRRCKKSILQPLPVKVPVSALPDWLQSDDDEEIDFEGFCLEEVLEEEAKAMKCIDEQDYSLFYEEIGESDKEESDFEGFELNEIDVSRTEKRRYPKRSTAKKIYTEEELSDEDEYLFCEDCQKIYHGDCPVHGPLATLDPSSGFDKASLQYTSVSVPKELTVKESKIPKAGLGVFATELIPNGVKFGPYKGQKVYYEYIDEDDDTSYMWEIKKPNESYYIDGQVESESNWMRYINCARNEEEQNLIAFQYHGEIYYRTFKDIRPGTELFVWYGDQYAKDLGIKTSVNNYGLFICKRCSNRFKSESNFKMHLQANKDCFKANPQIFTCGRCRESFYTLHKLQDHIRKHEEVRAETKIGFVKIEGNVTNSEERCQHGAKCRRKADCQRRFHCEYCGKSFTQRGDLNRHIRIHTGEKPYHCEYCDASFNQRAHLKKHIRIHTGEKPYHCEYCDASFTTSGHLNTHIRIHTGEKPYHCEYCDASFTTSGNLDTHIRIHTGEKPYHCEYCDKSFTVSSSLTTHIRAIHN